jgi:hypothetical protein
MSLNLIEVARLQTLTGGECEWKDTSDINIAQVGLGIKNLHRNLNVDASPALFTGTPEETGLRSAFDGNISTGSVSIPATNYVTRIFEKEHLIKSIKITCGTTPFTSFKIYSLNRAGSFATPGDFSLLDNVTSPSFPHTVTFTNPAYTKALKFENTGVAAGDLREFEIFISYLQTELTRKTFAYESDLLIRSGVADRVIIANLGANTKIGSVRYYTPDTSVKVTLDSSVDNSSYTAETLTSVTEVQGISTITDYASGSSGATQSVPSGNFCGFLIGDLSSVEPTLSGSITEIKVLAKPDWGGGTGTFYCFILRKVGTSKYALVAICPNTQQCTDANNWQTKTFDFTAGSSVIYSPIRTGDIVCFYTTGATGGAYGPQYRYLSGSGSDWQWTVWGTGAPATYLEYSIQSYATSYPSAGQVREGSGKKTYIKITNLLYRTAALSIANSKAQYLKLTEKAPTTNTKWLGKLEVIADETLGEWRDDGDTEVITSKTIGFRLGAPGSANPVKIKNKSGLTAEDIQISIEPVMDAGNHNLECSFDINFSSEAAIARHCKWNRLDAATPNCEKNNLNYRRNEAGGLVGCGRGCTQINGTDPATGLGYDGVNPASGGWETDQVSYGITVADQEVITAYVRSRSPSTATNSSTTGAVIANIQTI